MDYKADINSNNAGAMPITTEIAAPSSYAIYYSDTNEWSGPLNTWGKGMDDLLKHFQELES